MRAILALGVTVGLAAAARADTVNLQFVGVGQGRGVQVTIGSSVFDCFSGQLKHSFSAGNGSAAFLNGRTLVTFCCDLTETVSSSGTTYTVQPIANLPQSAGWPVMGAVRAQAVYNLYAAAARQQDPANANPDYAAAFQIALWDVVYDYNGTASSLSVTSGTFKAKAQGGGSPLSSAIMTNLNTLFAAITSGPNAPQTGLMGFGLCGAQDQIVETLVPLPAGAWMAMSGLGLAAIARRRVRR